MAARGSYAPLGTEAPEARAERGMGTGHGGGRSAVTTEDRQYLGQGHSRYGQVETYSVVDTAAMSKKDRAAATLGGPSPRCLCLAAAAAAAALLLAVAAVIYFLVFRRDGARVDETGWWLGAASNGTGNPAVATTFFFSTSVVTTFTASTSWVVTNFTELTTSTTTTTTTTVEDLSATVFVNITTLGTNATSSTPVHNSTTEIPWWTTSVPLDTTSSTTTLTSVTLTTMTSTVTETTVRSCFLSRTASHDGVDVSFRLEPLEHAFFAQDHQLLAAVREKMTRALAIEAGVEEEELAGCIDLNLSPSVLGTSAAVDAFLPVSFNATADTMALRLRDSSTFRRTLAAALSTIAKLRTPAGPLTRAAVSEPRVTPRYDCNYQEVDWEVAWPTSKLQWCITQKLEKQWKVPQLEL